MGRLAREKSSTGIYHVIIRGVGKQILFEEDEDYYYILHKIEKYKADQDIKVYCYCLMENHVHMLIYDRMDTLDCFMKKIGISYAAYYNHKYNRVGVLIQDRFKSEPIENDSYFSIVFRYIMQNPEKAHICPTKQYKWSSYKEYARNVKGLTDLEFALHYFGGKEALLSFVNVENNDKCMEQDFNRLTDSEAIEVIKRVLTIKSGTIIQSYSRNERDNALIKLKENGLSIRQIERLTGISRGVVYNAVAKGNQD